MKNIIFTITAIIAVQLCAFAQLPSLGKLKDKAKEAVSGKDKKESSSSSSSSSSSGSSSSSTKANADGRPEFDPESPIYSAYSITRDEISSVKSQMKPENWDKNPEGRNFDAAKYWNNANTNLDKLKADPKESKKPYVAEFDKQLKELDIERKAKFERFTTDEKYKGKMESYQRFATLGWEISDKTLEPSYKGYYAFKKEFETACPDEFKDSYIQGQIKQVDNFFQVEVYKVTPGLNAEVDKIIKEMYALNSRNEASYILNAKSYQKSFEKPLETIAYNKKFLMEKTEEIDAVKAKIDKEKAMLDEYISSGKLEANKAKYAKEIIDAVRLGKPAMTNTTYDAMAKTGAAEKGKVTRVVITSAVWTVAKTEYGFPLHKYLDVDLAITDATGKCWLAYGQIRKQYEGGGVYGAEYFNFWGLQDEMNCANITK